MNATTTPTYSSTVILASDFSNSTTDVLRNRWTGGKLRHLLAALGDTPVIVTTDGGSGHTLVGARMVRVFDGGPGRGLRVAIGYTLSDGTEQVTNYRADGLGAAIVPLEQDRITQGAKWVALQSYRNEQSAAIVLMQDAHGEVEGRAWGKWAATPHSAENGVDVTYTPHTGNPHFADQWGTRGYWRVSVADVAAKLAERATAGQ